MITKVIISPEDRAALKRLAASEDFQVLKRIVEDFQQQRAYNLMVTSDDSENILLSSYRGGYLLWRKVINLVEKQDEEES